MEPQINDVKVTYDVREDGRPSSWTLPATQLSPFTLEINSGTAIFRFNHPLHSFDDAERRLGEFLNSWEGEMLLQTGPRRRDFSIKEIRAPGHGVRGAYSDLHGTVSGPRAEANTRRYSPWRRHRYYHLPLVASLIQRYEAYRQFREQLSVVGYICLSALQHAFRGRAKLADALRIDRPVLDRFGALVSEVGTLATARKVDNGHDFRSFTASEQHWVEAVIRELINRAGQTFDRSAPLALLTEKELPPL